MPISNNSFITETSTLTLDGSGELSKPSINTEAINIILFGFTKINDDCFYSYNSLKNITLPDTLLSIGNNAFSRTKIEEIFLPKSVNQLSELQAFDFYYQMKRVIVDKRNPCFCDIDGVLYSKDMKVLWFYPGNRPEEICVVPYGIREIKCAAFAHSYFRKIIIIPPTVRIIRNWFGCGSNIIESVVIQQCKERVNFDEDHLISDVPGKNNSIIHYDSRCVNVRSCKSRHANSHDNIVRISLLVFLL